MSRKIIIYGNADKTTDGFPTAEAFQHYIAEGIFSNEDCRYRYTQGKVADVIVLSRGGLAYGHFDIEDIVEPTAADREAFSRVKKVYIVRRSYSYESPVRVSLIGLSNFQFGTTVSETQFKSLLRRAGKRRTHAPPLVTADRYCRICWNTNGWSRPSGTAIEAGGSYVAANEYGHEEWLFNYEWCIDGFKYGFLQPVNKHRKLLEGRTLAVALYTKTAGKTFLVATIRSIYVPTLSELDIVFEHYEERGWVTQMRKDIEVINGKQELIDPIPPNIINIRFRPQDVATYDPMLIFRDDHKVSRTNRYQALRWDDAEAPLPSTLPTVNITKSEARRIRAAQDPAMIDPKHARLQNRLHESLCAKYGRQAVVYEHEYVDLKVVTPQGAVFYEIKINSTAKKCIREALGQLVEYAVYPTAERASQWIVVGDPPATDDDIAYLTHLRKIYALPLYYARFDWETGDIGVPL